MLKKLKLLNKAAALLFSIFSTNLNHLQLLRTASSIPWDTRTYSQASFFFFAAPKLKFFFYTLFFFLSNQKLFWKYFLIGSANRTIVSNIQVNQV